MFIKSLLFYKHRFIFFLYVWSLSSVKDICKTLYVDGNFRIFDNCYSVF